MDPNETQKHIFPASLVLETLIDCRQFYFPESQRERFDRIADFFETQDQSYWLSELKRKKRKIEDALLDVRNLMSRPLIDDLVVSWDDAVFLFYIIRIQYVFIRLATLPADAVIPGKPEELWDWAMGPIEDDPWMLFPIWTITERDKCSIEIPFWRIVTPIDYHGSDEGW